MIKNPIILEEGMMVAKGRWTAEGPIWDSKRKVFFYTDIEGGTLHQYNPQNGTSTTWQIGCKGNGDKDGQMIGGTTAINHDGSLIVMLEGGINAGVNYFTPETGHLIHIPNSWPEGNKPHNRPNDSTVIHIHGKNRMVFGTMSKLWESELAEGKKEGAFYILDDKLQPQKLSIDSPYPGTVISNGLADGGCNSDGTINLFFAESVGSDSHINIWKGELHPETAHVKNVEVFADYQAITDGLKAHPDGANIILIDGKPAYAISVLQMGEIRAFDLDNGELIACVKLPEGISNVTKFAIGEDSMSRSALFVTTLNAEYPIAKDGLNGAVFLLPLPANISLHPASVQTTDYPFMEDMMSKFLGGLEVQCIEPTIPVLS